MKRLEQAGPGQGSTIMQVYLPLLPRPRQPQSRACGHRGYFLGGVLPRWFDGDGLMMQKLYAKPHFDTIRLYSQRAEKLLAFIKKDW